ncbi:MAG: DUF814 domain-containing protein [bacterium]|nr:DUF814 domain-containing protein [bacterium]
MTTGAGAERFRALKALHVGELTGEIDPLVRGAEVKDVQGLPPRDALLILVPTRDERILRLRLSADPDAARVHLQHARVRGHEGPIGPFFQRLAEELVGATLRRLEQVGGDRIVLLEFAGTPAGERRALVLEFFGRHANLVLLGRDDVVLDLLVGAPTKAKKKGTQRLEIGAAWAPPGGSARAPGGEEPAPLAQTLAEPAAPVPQNLTGLAPLSWRVEHVLGAIAETSHKDAERKRLEQRVTRKLGRARSLVAGLEKRETAADRSERVLHDGELLKAAVAQVRRGMESIELDDWYSEDGAKRRIALDPKRSPQENVQRLFDRYKKLERSRASVAEELERARTKRAALEALAAEAVESDDPAALDARAVERGLLDRRQEADVRKKKAPAPRLPYRSFLGCAGGEIRVGRTARDNDDLTFHHARGNDVWLHTADCPGSHVILRLERGKEPDEEELLDAAHLAVHFSPAKDAQRVPVHVARRKHVQKPKGAKAGLVRLSAGRILQVRVQPQRLERLLRSTRTQPE